MDETGALFDEDGFAVQMSRTLDNAETALAAARAVLADVIQWNVLLIEGVDPAAAYGGNRLPAGRCVTGSGDRGDNLPARGVRSTT